MSSGYSCVVAIKDHEIVSPAKLDQFWIWFTNGNKDTVYRHRKLVYNRQYPTEDNAMKPKKQKIRNLCAKHMNKFNKPVTHESKYVLSKKGYVKHKGKLYE